MQRACDITKAGFDRVLQFVKPGVMEYEIEAEFMHEFLRRGSRGFAYTQLLVRGSTHVFYTTSKMTVSVRMAM